MEIISSLLIWIGILVIFGGWLGWIGFLLTKKTTSLIPFIGSVALIIGVYLHPDKEFFSQFKPWVWLAVIVDLGTLPLLVSSIIFEKLKSENK